MTCKQAKEFLWSDGEVAETSLLRYRITGFDGYEWWGRLIGVWNGDWRAVSSPKDEILFQSGTWQRGR